MVEIKSTENASRVSDRDPTTSVFMCFITHVTWHHLERQSNGCDLTVEIRIRCVSLEPLIAN